MGVCFNLCGLMQLFGNHNPARNSVKERASRKVLSIEPGAKMSAVGEPGSQAPLCHALAGRKAPPGVTSKQTTASVHIAPNIDLNQQPTVRWLLRNAASDLPLSVICKPCYAVMPRTDVWIGFRPFPYPLELFRIHEQAVDAKYLEINRGESCCQTD